MKKLGFYGLKPVVMFSALTLLILTTSRFFLSLWLNERVTDSSGWFFILLQGVRVDIASICWFCLIPALLAALLPTEKAVGRVWVSVQRIWLVIGLWIFVYMELATVPFILEYDLRPNRLFIEYLVYPKEVFGMLFTGYKTELFIGLVGSLITFYYGWKFSGYATKNITMPKLHIRIIMAVLVVLVGVGGARSSLGHRPINPAAVSFSTDPLMNDLVLNSAYSVIFALKNMGSEKNATSMYGMMAKDRIVDLVRKSSAISGRFLNETTTLNYNSSSYEGPKKNLVILLQESLGARFVGGLGGLPLTPNLDVLIKEGWSFNQMYATGTRSVRGIEAMTTGFPPTPSRAVVKLSKSQNGFFNIAALLSDYGYMTQFIYGGESHFDNMKSFFLGNGFQNIVDESDYKQPIFTGSWGVSDEDLYNMADQQFTKMNKEDRPFFSLVFTSSNHSPFEYPDGKIEQYDAEKHTRNNTVKYSDYALGKFFEKAKQSEYWDNTIFVVIADHDSRVSATDLIPVDRFHIPAVIVGKDIQPRNDDRLASNIDMPSTLMSLIGVSSVSPMLGHDLTKPLLKEDERAMMQFANNFGYLTRDNLVVLTPGNTPYAYSYDFDTKTQQPMEVNSEVIDIAKANALWGSLAYNQNLYTMPKSSEINKIISEFEKR